jgi:hypothetical protein
VWIDPKRDSHFVIERMAAAILPMMMAALVLANTPAVGQYYAVTVDNDKPYNVFGGLQDNNVCMVLRITDDKEWQSTVIIL